MDLDECKVRFGWFTGQPVCTACAPDCDHYICTHEDEERDDDA